MNKRHYEHTLPNIRGSLSNTYDYLRCHKMCILVLSEKRFRIKIKWRTPPTFTVIGTLFAKFKKMWFVTEFGDVSFNSDV